MTRAAVIIPRGLKLEDAARYIGIGRTKFLELVDTGQIPRPRRLGARVLWDIRELDLAFDDIPRDGEEASGWQHGND